VTGGIYVRRHFSEIVAPATRLQARAVWDVLVFVLNGVIFIVLGLQLGAIRSEAFEGDWSNLLRAAVVVSATAILVRLLWVPLAAWLPRIVSASLRQRDPMPLFRHLFLIG
jgi:CPA1 family monovalent cation:H+ antiporter